MAIGNAHPASRGHFLGPTRAWWESTSRARRSLGLLAAAVATLGGIAIAAAGVTLLVLDQSERDVNGYLMTTPTTYRANSYAIVSDNYRAGTVSDWFMSSALLDSVQLRVKSDRSIFVGIGRAGAVKRYLRNVARDEGPRFDAPRSAFIAQQGGAPRALPTALHVWSASTVGTGARTLKWPAKSGDWRIVVMNADATKSVAARLSIGARFPHLVLAGIGALVTGLLVLLVGGAELTLALRRR
jgi:hypothetical protein